MCVTKMKNKKQKPQKNPKKAPKKPQNSTPLIMEIYQQLDALQKKQTYVKQRQPNGSKLYVLYFYHTYWALHNMQLISLPGG